jgi:hypothetical protein
MSLNVGLAGRPSKFAARRRSDALLSLRGHAPDTFVNGLLDASLHSFEKLIAHLLRL